jgi:hypothetical protein
MPYTKKKTFPEEYQEFLTDHNFETILAKANSISYNNPRPKGRGK